MARSTRKPKKETRRSSRIEPLQFICSPDGRRSPKISNDKNDRIDDESNSRPVKKRRLSRNEPTSWMKNDQDFTPEIETKRRRHRKDQQKGTRRNRARDFHAPTAVIIGGGQKSKDDSSRKKWAKTNSNAAVVVNENENEQRRKDISLFTRIRPAVDQSNPDIFDRSPPPLATSSRIDLALTSYFRVTKNAVETSTSKKPTPRRRGLAANILFANFIANGSSDSNDDDDVREIKTEPNPSQSSRILAVDTPPREFDFGLMKRRKLEQRKEAKKEKKRLLRKVPKKN